MKFFFYMAMIKLTILYSPIANINAVDDLNNVLECFPAIRPSAETVTNLSIADECTGFAGSP